MSVTKTAPAPAAGATLSKGEVAFVNLVNMKLRNFDRPVLLACVIQGFVFVASLIVFLSFLLNCPVIQNGPMAIAPLGEIKLMGEEGAFSCLRSVFFLKDQPLGMEYHYMGAHSMLGLHACVPPGGDLSAINTEWCTDDNIRNFKQEDMDKMPHCPGTGSEGDLYGFYYDQRNCRDFGEALALAFGAGSQIQIFATVLFIVILSKMGVVKQTGGPSGMGSLITNQITKAEVEQMLRDAQTTKSDAEKLENGEAGSKEAAIANAA